MPKGSEKTWGEPSPASVVTRACHAMGVGIGFRVRRNTLNTIKMTATRSIKTRSALRINGLIQVKLGLGEHLLHAFNVASDVQAVDQRVGPFHLEFYQGPIVFVW